MGGFIIVQKSRTYISPIQRPRWNTYHRLHQFYRLLFYHKPIMVVEPRIISELVVFS